MTTTYATKEYSAASYLEHRPHYPRHLYDTVLAFHVRDGLGQNGLALDLGCGPVSGNCGAPILTGSSETQIWELIVIGIDASEVMIEIARQHVPKAEFRVESADNLTSIESQSIDLLTVGTAAHWFPEGWWKEASRVLKPGGTVALWVYCDYMIMEPGHPKSLELNKHFMSYREGIGHSSVGNEVAADMYKKSLPLPAATLNFGPITRISWNPDGLIDDSEEGGKGNLVMKDTLTLPKLRQRMHTYSPIHRWRTANPTKKDTPEDPVEQTLSKLREIAGWNDSSEFVCGLPLTLLMLKKK
ncbi:hypothetical protein CROQUDRAFT_657110 [Cronartium quercuum f. sp. fusiforme G11]|uniref:Methyltransferase type 11 domain-containing protein n=1 Tax=Cronartium quercuum f. sp. fusiforme G11 TaxID=708437 RepID=A0A9P6TBU0_9BASI|nr:hypothetical protein CROQUDRAFT_657110 [Cronartium quercuum f. sp. fusiforme G11]